MLALDEYLQKVQSKIFLNISQLIFFRFVESSDVLESLMNYVELSLAATQSNYTFFHLVNEVHGAAECPGVFDVGWKRLS